MNSDKNPLNFDHPDSPVFNSLPVNLSERLDLKELVTTYDEETRLSNSQSHDQSNVRTSGSSQNEENKSCSLTVTDDKQNIFEFYKADSKKNNITEIKEEEEMTMSQELNTKSIDQDTLFKKKGILKRGGSDSDHEGTSKKIAVREDSSIVSKASSYDKSDYYMVVDQHIDEINQKMNMEKINSKQNKSPQHRLSIKRKTTLQPDMFHINDWSDLQEKLKDEYNFMSQENEMKTNMINQMKMSLKDYYRNYIKLRESREISNAVSSITPKKEEEVKKILLSEEDENKIYCEAYTFVKGMLFNLVSNPVLLAKIVKLNNEIYSLQNEKYERVIDAFTESFFENITDDEPYELNQIKFLSELLKFEIDQLHDQESSNKTLFSSKSFGAKIINHYTKRQECEKYLKYVLENPLIAVLKTNEDLDIDIKKIEAVVNHKNEKRKRLDASRSSSVLQNPLNFKKDKKSNPAFNSIAIDSSNSLSLTQSINFAADKRKNSTCYYVHMFKEYDPTKLEPLNKNKFLLSNSLSKFLNFWNESKIPKFVSKNKEEDRNTSPIPVQKEKSSILLTQSEMFLKPSITKDFGKSGNLLVHKVEAILNSNVEKIKSLLFCFMDSIFSNLYNMPVGIRIICKLIKTLALKHFPNMTTWQVNCLIGNFLIDKWILPLFLRPIFSNIFHDLKTKNINNIMLLNKIITKIFKGQIYDQDDILGISFNGFIEQIRKSVEEYYEELTNISDFIVEKIFADQPNLFDKTTTKNIRSVSICVSLEDIQVLCDMIIKSSLQFTKDEAKILNYVTKINVYEKEKKLFSKQELVESNKTYRSDQLYTLFVDIIFPEKLSINYMDVVYKLKNIKNLGNEERLLIKIKHILKQILISIDRVNSLSTLNCRKNSTLAEILENYQEKVYLNDCLNMKSQEKVPISLSAKFLLSSVGKIDEKYRCNNWQLMQIEMMKEFTERFQEITEVVYLTKSQLLKAIDNIKRYNSLLVDAYESQKRLDKQKWLFQKFIEETQIKVCVTSPITRASVLLPYKAINKEQGNEELSNKIIICNQKDCLHERFSFMKDLTSNTGGPRMDKRKPDKHDTHNGAHCDTIKEFIESFGSLPEVREVVSEGEDIYGVQEAFSLYLNSLQNSLKESKYFENATNEEINFLLESLEKFITRKFYNKVFPEQKTLKDAGLYTSFRVLDWISYDDLDILPRNRVDDMWDCAIQHLNNLDLAMTPIDKLRCFVDCFKTIVNVLALTNDKGESAGADESLPISIYVLLKAAPQRLYSNINFISIFRNSQQKMLSQDGYSFTQISIAIAFIESLTHDQLKMTQYDFDKKVYEKEMEYEIYFIKDRPRFERSNVVINLEEQTKQGPNLKNELNLAMMESASIN